MTVPVSFFDRPSVAIANLLTGDLRSAVKALIAPDTLAPERSKTLAELIEERIGKNPLVSAAAAMATDPFIILGLALSMKYPPAPLATMFATGDKWAVQNRGIGMVEGKIMRAEGLLQGSKLGDLMVKSVDEGWKLRQSASTPMLEALGAYKKQTGHTATIKDMVECMVRGDEDGWTAPWAGTEGFRNIYGAPPVTPVEVPIKMTPEVQGLYDFLFTGAPKTPAYNRFMWDKVVEPVKNSPSGEAVLRVIRGTPPEEPLAFNPRGNFVPHVPAVGTLEETLQWNRLGETLAEGGKAFDRQAREGLKKAAGRSMFARVGTMGPDWDEIKAAGLKVNPEFEVWFKGRRDALTRSLTEQVQRLVEQIQSKNYGRSAAATAIEEWLQGTGEWNNRVGPRAPRGYYELDVTRAADAAARAAQARTPHNWDALTNELLGTATKLGAYRPYMMNPVAAWTSYTYSMSRPYVWHAQGLVKDIMGTDVSLGQAMLDETAKLTQEGRAFMQEYLPIIQGRTNEAQTKSVLKWTNTRMDAVAWLKNPESGSKYLPASWNKWLVGKLTAERGPFTYLNASNGLAGYFYYSTIAGNPATTFENLLQTILTTLPLLGPEATGMGITNAFQKTQKYYDLRWGARKLDVGAAMKEAFPEFSRVPHLGGQYTLSQTIISGELENAWQVAANSVPEGLSAYVGAGKNPLLEKAKQLAMSMFSQSELWNRHVAFEGALWKGTEEALARGLSRIDAVEETIPLAAKVVRMSQFAMGPGQMPHGLLNWAAPWRQFMYFPLRYLGFLAESTRQGIGPLTAAGTPSWTTMGGARQWGTVGRGIAASEATRVLGSNLLGMDLSGGLMTGALPAPGIPGTPWYPAPIVPPIFSIPALLAQAAQTQTTEPLEQAAALMTPMGIPLYRAYKSGVLPQLGIPLGEKYAGWDKRDEQGRVPVYDATGKLIMHRTPTQMFMKAAGLQSDDVVKEREMVGYLLRHRDRIRDIRRQYVDAVYDNDPQQADRVQAYFKQEYPDLGEMQVKQSDLTAADRRRQMSRLQRLLETFPKEYRQEFQNVVGTAMSADMVGQFPQQAAPTPLVDTEEFQGLMNFQPPPTEYGVPGALNYGGFPGLGGIPAGGPAFNLQPRF